MAGTPATSGWASGLAARLDAEYPFLCSDTCGRHAGRALDSRRVALVLDGSPSPIRFVTLALPSALGYGDL